MSVSRDAILEAVREARERSKKRNFTQSFELIINLRDVDLKRPENRINERVELPKGLGSKSQKVCVFASGGMALRAKREGADHVITGDELKTYVDSRKELKKILKEYDMFIAEAPLMPLVGRIAGPILGPRGRMPTPVPPNAPLKDVIERHRRMVVLRTRDKPYLMCKVGDETMSDEDIAENIEAVISAVMGKLKKGIRNIKSIYVKTTMGEAVEIKV